MVSNITATLFTLVFLLFLVGALWYKRVIPPVLAGGRGRSLLLQAHYREYGGKKSNRFIREKLKQPLNNIATLWWAIIAALVMGVALPLAIVWCFQAYLDPRLPALGAGEFQSLVEIEAALVGSSFVGIIFMFQYLRDRDYGQSTIRNFIRDTRLMPILYLSLASTGVMIVYYFYVSFDQSILTVATWGAFALVPMTLLLIIQLYKNIPDVAADDPLDRFLKSDIIQETNKQFKRWRLQRSAQEILEELEPIQIVTQQGELQTIGEWLHIEELQSHLLTIFGYERTTISDIDIKRLKQAAEQPLSDGRHRAGNTPPGNDLFLNLNSLENKGILVNEDRISKSEVSKAIVTSWGQSPWTASSDQFQTQLTQLERLGEITLQDRNNVIFKKYVNAYQEIGEHIADELRDGGFEPDSEATSFPKYLSKSILETYESTTENGDKDAAELIGHATENLIDYSLSESSPADSSPLAFEAYIELLYELNAPGTTSSMAPDSRPQSEKYGQLFKDLLNMLDDAGQNSDLLWRATLNSYMNLCESFLEAGEYKQFTELFDQSPLGRALLIANHSEEVNELEKKEEFDPKSRYTGYLLLAERVTTDNSEFILAHQTTTFLLTARAFAVYRENESQSSHLMKILQQQLNDWYAEPLAVEFLNDFVRNQRVQVTTEAFDVDNDSWYSDFCVLLEMLHEARTESHKEPPQLHNDLSTHDYETTKEKLKDTNILGVIPSDDSRV